MKYFLDTEFIEDGRTIDLISIGVVCEDGRELYLESSEVDWSKANDWVLAYVKPHLWGVDLDVVAPRDEIAERLRLFVAQGRPEFWGYYADYDWVVVAQLYGTMMDLPSGWPMFCMDLKQYCVSLGDPRLPEQTSTEHHALADARWVRDSHLWLRAVDESPAQVPNQ